MAELLMRGGRVAEADPIWTQMKADTPDDVWLYNNAGHRTSWMTGHVYGRLDFLHLTGKATLTHHAPLTDTGRAAAITGLRHHAQQPRNRP